MEKKKKKLDGEVPAKRHRLDGNKNIAVDIRHRM
jgi:hypothetical protein